MSNYFIYQRVSTKQQNLTRQEGAIGDYCTANNIVVPEENIYSDVITGKTIKRENYQLMKSRLQKNDILIMLDLDRLGRNWDLIKAEWKDLTDKGVYIIIVNCPLINVLPDKSGVISVDKRLIQEMMFTLLCYVSQKEVEKIGMRTKEALSALKANGVKLGAPCKYGDEEMARVKEMHESGMSLREIARNTGMARGTVERLWNACKK